jgi:hypothetical protein
MEEAVNRSKSVDVPLNRRCWISWERDNTYGIDFCPPTPLGCSIALSGGVLVLYNLPLSGLLFDTPSTDEANLS